MLNTRKSRKNLEVVSSHFEVEAVSEREMKASLLRKSYKLQLA
jgi:hypothetical protein